VNASPALGLLAALCGACGTYLLLTARWFGWRGRAPHPSAATRQRRCTNPARQWLTQAGLADVGVGAFVAVVGILGLGGAACGLALFGSPLPAAGGALAAAAAPIGMYRSRRNVRRQRAADEWPRLIDELRVRAGALGRSIPQALFEIGAGAPDELRPAFEAAQREWLIGTDFARALDVLRTRLADGTADLVCETLLIAHELGGSDVGPRLAALAEDRRRDVASRRDALARQSGVRFARRFVIVVPIGMAAAGSLIGTGRAAYASSTGQLLVLAAMALMALCWLWAGRFLRLPEPARVFTTDSGGGPLSRPGGVQP